MRVVLVWRASPNSTAPLSPMQLAGMGEMKLGKGEKEPTANKEGLEGMVGSEGLGELGGTDRTNAVVCGADGDMRQGTRCKQEIFFSGNDKVGEKRTMDVELCEIFVASQRLTKGDGAAVGDAVVYQRKYVRGGRVCGQRTDN